MRSKFEFGFGVVHLLFVVGLLDVCSTDACSLRCWLQIDMVNSVQQLNRNRNEVEAAKSAVRSVREGGRGGCQHAFKWQPWQVCGQLMSLFFRMLLLPDMLPTQKMYLVHFLKSS